MLAQQRQSSSFSLQRFIMDRDREDEDDDEDERRPEGHHPAAAASNRIVLRPPSDPDAQTTVNDFIDYTEYLPADLVRSLSLIRRLDETYLETTQQVHDLTKLYGVLPTATSGPNSAKNPNPVELRRLISERLDRAVSLRECAYAEACRIYDVADRHFNRLNCIQSKLGDLMATVGLENPIADSGATSVAGDASSSTAANVTAKDDAVKKTPYASGPRNREHKAALQVKSAGRKEPLKPSKHGDQRLPKTGASRHHANRASPRHKPAAATSQQLGSEQNPWLRLTEQELSILRTRLKKSRTWQPSVSMISRELAIRGRGWDNYVQAKYDAETNQEEFVDCDASVQRQGGDGSNAVTASSGDGKTNGDTTTQQSRKRKLHDVTHDTLAPTGVTRLPRRSKINAASALSTTETRTPAPTTAPARTRLRDGNPLEKKSTTKKGAIADQRKSTSDRKEEIQNYDGEEEEDDDDDDGAAEPIDPNEPRYCICDDVSYGTMICCENDYCEKEWFHLKCVGLSQIPGRAAKWYCPDCRPKMAQSTRSRGSEVRGRKR